MNRFITAIKNLDLTSVRQQLSENPQWINWTDKTGKNPLHYLCAVPVDDDRKKASDSVAIAKLLLDKGIDINAANIIQSNNCDFPATPVWYAYAKGRNEKLYTYLLNHGANPDHCMFAIAWNDDERAAELFKSHGAPVEDAAFLSAYLWRRIKMADWFLKNGADVNHTGAEGYSALHLAVKRKAPLEQVKWLLSYGANPHLPDKNGITPEQIASENRQKAMLELFRSHQLHQQ